MVNGTSKLYQEINGRLVFDFALYNLCDRGRNIPFAMGQIH